LATKQPTCDPGHPCTRWREGSGIGLPFRSPAGDGCVTHCGEKRATETKPRRAAGKRSPTGTRGFHGTFARQRYGECRNRSAIWALLAAAGIGVGLRNRQRLFGDEQRLNAVLNIPCVCIQRKPAIIQSSTLIVEVSAQGESQDQPNRKFGGQNGASAVSVFALFYQDFANHRLECVGERGKTEGSTNPGKSIGHSCKHRFSVLLSILPKDT